MLIEKQTTPTSSSIGATYWLQILYIAPLELLIDIDSVF